MGGSNIIFIDGEEVTVTLDNEADVFQRYKAYREQQLGRQLYDSEERTISEAIHTAAQGSSYNKNETLASKIIADREKEAPFLTGVSNALAGIGNAAKNFTLPKNPLGEFTNQLAIAAAVFIVFQILSGSDK